MARTMTFVSLFAGVGGFDLGFERAGMKCVAQVEKNEDCLVVLNKRFPTAEKHKDIKDFHYGRAVDLVCGGFPCQDVSIAGERAGLFGKRSGLWFEFKRVVCEIRPRWVVVENVVGLLSSNYGWDFREILRGLSDCGYDAEWDCIPASTFGAPHERQRLFIVAYPIGTRLSGRIFEEGICRTEEKASTEFGNRNVACGAWWLENISNIRVGDGVSPRVARRTLRLYGNAVVPQVSEWLGKRIIELDKSLFFEVSHG